MIKSAHLGQLVVGFAAVLILAGCGVGDEELFDEEGLGELMGGSDKADSVPYQLCFDDQRVLAYKLWLLQEPLPWGVKTTFSLNEESTSNVKIEPFHSAGVVTSDWERGFLPVQWIIEPGDQRSTYTWLGLHDSADSTGEDGPELELAFSKSTLLTQLYGEIFEREEACVGVRFEYRYCGPEVLGDLQHPDQAFCAEVASFSERSMSEEYAQELLGR